MKKFSAGVYGFSKNTIFIFGLILTILIATLIGLFISFGEKITITLIKNLAGDKIDVAEMTTKITNFFNGINWKCTNLSITGIVLITIFSINIALISMFVLFGIISCNYRRKLKKAGKQALSKQKNKDVQSQPQSQTYDYQPQPVDSYVYKTPELPVFN